MIKDMLNKFSGGQLTAIVLALIFVPGAVGAAVTFQPVAIVDPVTGKQSYVDNGRRLGVHDPIAGYRTNPVYLFKLSWNVLTTDSAPHTLYTVPAGKALILTSINAAYYQGVAGNDNYVNFYTLVGYGYIGGFDDTNAAAAHSTDLGPGFYLRAGDGVQYQASNNSNSSMGASVSLTGYLVPVGAVPASSPAIAAEQAVIGTGAPRGNAKR